MTTTTSAQPSPFQKKPCAGLRLAAGLCVVVAIASGCGKTNMKGAAQKEQPPKNSLANPLETSASTLTDRIGEAIGKSDSKIVCTDGASAGSDSRTVCKTATVTLKDGRVVGGIEAIPCASIPSDVSTVTCVNGIPVLKTATGATPSDNPEVQSNGTLLTKVGAEVIAGKPTLTQEVMVGQEGIVSLKDGTVLGRIKENSGGMSNQTPTTGTGTEVPPGTSTVNTNPVDPLSQPPAGPVPPGATINHTSVCAPKTYRFGDKCEAAMPIYHWHNRTTGDHFYSPNTGPECYQQIGTGKCNGELINPPQNGYDYVRIEFYALVSKEITSKEMRKWYRMWTFKNSSHFYTIDETERQTAKTTMEYTDEGYYITFDHSVPYSSPLHRWRHKTNGHDYYTTETLSDNNYSYQGISTYVFSPK